MACIVGKDLERDVRAGADLQHSAEIGQPPDQVRILDRPHAMANPAGSYQVQRVGDGKGAAEFAGMYGQPEARLAHDVEGRGIVGHPVHPLLAGHVEAGHQRVVERRRPFGPGEHVFRPQMPFADDHHAAFDAGLLPGGKNAGRQSADIVVGRQADGLAMVGRDEQLAIDRVRGGQLEKIGLGQRSIVLGRAKDGRDEIIAGYEAGEIVPHIGAVLDEAIGCHAVFLRLRDRQSRRCGALHVAVEFGLLQMCRQRKLRPCGPAGMPRWAAIVSPISA